MTFQRETQDIRVEYVQIKLPHSTADQELTSDDVLS